MASIWVAQVRLAAAMAVPVRAVYEDDTSCVSALCAKLDESVMIHYFIVLKWHALRE